MQAHLRDVAGSVPDHHTKVSIAVRRVLVVKGLCLQFIEGRKRRRKGGGRKEKETSVK